MIDKINIKHELTYQEWRALEPIQRTFAIGDIGEYMWAFHCSKKGSYGIKKTDYNIDGYDIVRMNKMGMAITTEVKTMKFPYNGNPWPRYFFETNNKTRTKKPQYMTCEVDEYVIYDMHDNMFHVYDCKTLATFLNIVVDEDYDGRFGWGFYEVMNTQRTAWGIWLHGDKKFLPYVGFKYSIDASTIPDKIAWIYEYAKIDSNGRLQ